MPRLAPVAAAIAIALTTGCAGLPSRASEGLTLTQSIDQEIAKDEAIVWAQRRPLTWPDFKEKPPAEVSAVAAQTGYTLVHGARCTGSTFEYRVVAAFRPNDSWVKPSM